MYKEMYPHEDLVNLSEEIIFEQIHLLLQEDPSALTTNAMVLQDIAALALNRMPPKYVTNILERHHPSQGLREEVEDLRKYARRQVLKAIKRVSEHPHE